MPTTVYTEEEMTNVLKAAIEDRAEWFWRLYFGFKKIDPEQAQKVAEDAIFEFGKRKALKMHLPNDANARVFVEGVMTGAAKEAFGMTATKLDSEESSIHFSCCPFMDVYDKLGLTMEEKQELCKVASCGDFGMVAMFPHLKLDFPQLLSNGDCCCHFHVTKR